MSKKKKKRKDRYIVNGIETDRESAEMAWSLASASIPMSSFLDMFGFRPNHSIPEFPNLKDYVGKSIDGTIVGNVNTLPDLSAVTSQSETLYVRQPSVLEYKQLIDIDASKEVNIKRTYVFVCKKNQAKKVLTFSSKSYFIRSILCYSSLAPTYSRIKDQWEELIDQKNDSADILMIPDVYVYSKHPMSINIMVVSVPDFKDETVDDSGLATDEFKAYLENVVSSVATGAIKTKCDRLAIEPFEGLKLLEKYPYEAASAWDKVLNNEPCTKMIPDIRFSIEDETMLVIFSSAIH